MNRNNTHYLVLTLIVVIAAIFRFYGESWDGGYLFHPDERKIVLVATQLAMPQNVLEFLSAESPLNPKFFAYGSLPIYLLRALSMLAPDTHYGVPWREDNFVALGMLGRVLSGIFDLGTLILVFLLARKLYDSRIALVSCALLAVTVLDIQLAHFYAVDTVLTFLVTATLYLAVRFYYSRKNINLILMSLSFGLALATKVTAAPLIIPLVLVIVQVNQRGKDGLTRRKEYAPRLQPAVEAIGVETGQNLAFSESKPAVRLGRTQGRVPIVGKSIPTLKGWAAELWQVRRSIAKLLAIALAVFLITQPYVLLDPIRYFGQVGTELLVARGWLDFPYTRQYAGTIPFLYQIQQSSVWGMGLPLGVFAWAGAGLFAWQWWKDRRFVDAFILAWACVYLASIGAQHAKYLRYLLPLTPFLIIMATVAFGRLLAQFHRPLARAAMLSGLALVGVSALAYSLSFETMYSREHPWLQVSRWIYQNVPSQSKIVTEQWDDLLPVPMSLQNTVRTPTDYDIKQLPMYDPDDGNKIQTLVNTLAESDYVILASQRLYTTIPRLAARYPVSSRYYQLLFNGRLGYELAAYARNDLGYGDLTIQNDTFSDSGLTVPPLLKQSPPTSVIWNWGKADESFVVYDHPMPLVFKKVHALSADELRDLLVP